VTADIDTNLMIRHYTLLSTLTITQIEHRIGNVSKTSIAKMQAFILSTARLINNGPTQDNDRK
jgi:hypothetical protein